MEGTGEKGAAGLKFEWKVCFESIGQAVLLGDEDRGFQTRSLILGSALKKAGVKTSSSHQRKS